MEDGVSGSEGSICVGNGDAVSADIFELNVRTGELPALRCRVLCELVGLRVGVMRVLDVHTSGDVSRMVGLRSSPGESGDVKSAQVRRYVQSMSSSLSGPLPAAKDARERMPEQSAYRWSS